MSAPPDLDTVLLCGGRGTRAYPDTAVLPKPLLTVVGIPIVDHVIAIYAAAGCRRFVLAGGYKCDLLAARYARPVGDLIIDVIDTGEDTDTGDRLQQAAQHVRSERFFASYADGVGDVDLAALLETHIDRGVAATLTTVPLKSQYGTIVTDHHGLVREFREKPTLPDHWINGGFFVFDQRAFEHWTGTSLENDALPALARAGELSAYRHDGFWMSMDTYKDRQALESLVGEGHPPWLPTERGRQVLSLASRESNASYSDATASQS